MPDHPFHPYFRFLVDHQELLSKNSVDDESKVDSAPDQADRGGGALSLLGSVYGSGEDEEGAMENAAGVDTKESVEAVVATSKTSNDGPEQKASSLSVSEKDETVPKHSALLKEKASVIKRNLSVTTVKAGITRVKKESDTSSREKTRASSLPVTSKVELPVVEPPSDLKRAVDKIVEFILKNGRELEAVLVEQDVKHGRFPFLLPSNLYHPYYLKVLIEKSKLHGKGYISEKHDSFGLGSEKKAAPSRESDSLVGSDIPYDSDRKEKFKMVISKSKKDGQDPPSKPTQPQIGVSVDAAAAAAILQAATRGIKNPNLEMISKTSLNINSQAPSGDLSSQPRSSVEKPGQRGEPSVSGPVANAIAKTAAIAAAGEADSSEACLTKEEKLKAERLKRAKMFAALIKSGSAPLKTEPSGGLSAEPPESGMSGSGVEGGSLFRKEREGSSVALEAKNSDNNEKHENIDSGIDHNEHRSKRKYRSRSKRHEEEDSGQEEEEEEEEEKGKEKHSHKKRRSHHSSHHGRDRHKHKKRHSSSKDRHSRHRHKHDSSSDDERGHSPDYSETNHHHSRNRPKRDSSSDIEHRRSRSRNEHNYSSEDEHLHSRHSHKHDRSSEDEGRRHRHHHKHRSSTNDESRHRRKRSQSRREAELEEGEICAKSDQSKLSEGNGASREASVDISKADAKGRAPSLPSETTAISDDLRAKIRAMLMATM
ncbi:hypothetical protein PTKIN_Ptkin11bG0185200 [Pterospermum kingtungense]